MKGQFRDFVVSVLEGEKTVSLQNLETICFDDTSLIADFCGCLYNTARYDELSVFLEYTHPHHGAMTQYCPSTITRSMEIDYNRRKRDNSGDINEI